MLSGHSHCPRLCVRLGQNQCSVFEKTMQRLRVQKSYVSAISDFEKSGISAQRIRQVGGLDIVFSIKNIFWLANSNDHNFLNFWRRTKFLVSRIISCSRSLHLSQKWRDLEQEIILDTRNFVLRQKLRKLWSFEFANQKMACGRRLRKCETALRRNS